MRRTSSDSSESRPVLWIETGVVLAWLAAPTLAWVACWLFWGSDYLQLNRQILHLEDRTSTTFAIGSMESLFSSLRLIPIVLFIMWRSGDKWSRFGLVKPKLAKDILIGMGLLLMIGVMKEMGRIIETPSYHWTWSRLFPAAVPPDRALLLLASTCAIGFSEELIARGYLIPRFETLIGSTWKSILVSAIIFGILHIHKGPLGAVTSCVSAVIWGIGFCATRRIWPVAISHALWDYIGDSHINALLTG